MPAPDIVVGRLPLYLRALSQMLEEGKTITSSQELGEKLGISSAQIRKDLSQFGEFGKQGTGYNIGYLTEQLKRIRKADRGCCVGSPGGTGPKRHQPAGRSRDPGHPMLRSNLRQCAEGREGAVH